MQEFFHSVTLDRDKCRGCINCIKRCPTEAIRVRNKKAQIIAERCIDCGECIRVCPHHAKRATSDKLSILSKFEYTIALPAPSFVAQFNNLEDVDIVLNALIDFGFDEVYEVARAAEIVSAATRKLMEEGALPRPVISSACPAVTRLIRVRFPSLIDHILPLNAPLEVAARLAKRAAAEKTGLPPEKIGAIFLSPCPAKVTAIRMPLGTEKSAVDGAIAVSSIYPRLLSYMKEAAEKNLRFLSEAGRIGISWGSSGGESAGLIGDNYLAADGIENVIRVLEDLEDEKFRDVNFIELDACAGGCVGGVLNVENPYVAKTKLYRIRKNLPVSLNHLEDADLISNGHSEEALCWDVPLEFVPVLKLDDDVFEAMRKMEQVEQITASLEGLDCGSCGAPSCRALAEDVVRGLASVDDCVFRSISVPAPFREQDNEDK
ncbi:MAG: [Fe-Fe] hydrogenase large subunit C-terminal domain-containing protein [Candidatus Faecivivens sp.]|mgnify:CR=1 FL=1|nr:4Fe-4S dicluster domain-containing protein [Oscillospiraceae bacterium]MDY2713412.1 [Fe-Fe] hydrogenase large subunit C-terminal domain-containing protein [Candidatus Faecivivens sp.]